MPIKMNCPSCGKTLSAPDAAAGKKAKCPTCGQVMTVPAVVLKAENVSAPAPAPSTPVSPQPSAGPRENLTDPMRGPAVAPTPSGPGGEARRPCPECGEMIIVGAAKCRFCNAIFDPQLKLLEKNRPGSANENLRQVATYQRGLIFCILIYILAAVAYGVLTQVNRFLAVIPSLVVLCAIIAGIVFAILVATRVYSTGTGIVLGILVIIPCVGLVILLVINQAATKMLTGNGIKVGFFGANMSQF